MKVGLIINNPECGRWTSYYVKDNIAYLPNGTPYNGPGKNDGIDCKVFRNIWNRTFMGHEGYFIKPNEGLPDIDLDVIFVVFEHSGDVQSFIKNIRAKYKNAILIGTTKEAIPGLDTKPVTGLQTLFSLCDKVAIQFNEQVCDSLSKKMGLKIHSLPIPYKLDYIRSKYKTDNNEKLILAGACSWDSKRGYDNCLDISNYLASKYGYKVVENNADKSWHEWLQLIDRVSFVINTDTQHRLGQVTIESIALGTPHLGGLSDTIKTIIPSWATNKKKDIENLFCNILETNYDLTDNYFYEKLKNRYSFRILNNKLKSIIEE
tara:strand:+ start:1990 stop:2946 length:957 start_codon:yes stop_codon:yes gene_type:complete